MVEDTSQSGEISVDLQLVGSELRRCRPRAYFLILLFLTILIYYVNSSEVSDVWTTMHIIYNSTYLSAASAATFLIRPLVQANTTIVQARNISDTEQNRSHTAPPTAAGAEQCKAETQFHVAYPCNYHYIINEPERCRNNSPFLVLMVPVAPSNRAARDAVRSTWGSEKIVMEKAVSLFFILGQSSPDGREEQQQKLLQESEEYHDIVQSDFLDSYNNLTIKTMVIMEWLASYCQNAFFAMKIDSDMFLNMDNLVNMILHAPRQNYITGLVAKGALVLRDPHSKWYLPKDVFHENYYPPYALGLGYVLSLDLPGKLVEGAKQVKAIYIEDVTIGLIMRHLGLSFTSQKDNGLFNVFPVPYNRCHYSKLIATTTNNLQEQVNLWKDLKTPGPTC